MALVKQLANEVAELRTELSKIKKGNCSEPSLTEYIHKFKKEVEEQIEDRTNRQLRKTLVFKGIPESDDEKSWQETKSLLSEKIGMSLRITKEKAASMIDRCHRGGDKKFYREKRKCRPIYAAMHNWDDCEKICQAARSMNQYSADYKYGPKTTKRRNLALQKRKELKENGSLQKAFLKFPACLMGKRLAMTNIELSRIFLKQMFRPHCVLFFVVCVFFLIFFLGNT